MLKAFRKKLQVTYKSNPMIITLDFSAQILKARRTWSNVFQALQEKIVNQDFCILHS